MPRIEGLQFIEELGIGKLQLIEGLEIERLQLTRKTD